MNWNDCRCRSQRRLRRAPRTGMQHAKSWKTGGRASSGFIIGAKALRDRLAEAPADVSGGAVGAALDEPQDRGAGRPRMEEAVAHGRDLLSLGGEPREEVVTVVV